MLDSADTMQIITLIIAVAEGIGICVVAFANFRHNKQLTEINGNLNKDLARLKSRLESRAFISKLRFDAEFTIYRELSESFFRLNKAIVSMAHPVYGRTQEDDKKQWENDKKYCDLANERLIEASDSLYRNAPFIQQEIFDGYTGLLKKCEVHIDTFAKELKICAGSGYKADPEIEARNSQLSKEINDNLLELNGRIREYLKSLEITS